MEKLEMSNMQEIEGGWSWEGCARGVGVGIASGIIQQHATVGSFFGGWGAVAAGGASMAALCVAGGIGS